MFGIARAAAVKKPGLRGNAGSGISVILQTLRCKQWTKNFFIFAGIVFARRFFVIPDLIRVALGFAVFCLVSSGLYIINDLMDLEHDRAHPRKSLRPLARGAISIPAALAVMVLAFSAGAYIALQLGPEFLWVVSGYAVLIILYSMYLKKLAIIDVMTIAAGFVLRTLAGTVLIRVPHSSWLLVCTLLLALFLALIKRRQELFAANANGNGGRKVLESYSAVFLDQAITIITASTLTGYFLYTFGSKHGERLMLTIPFVLYGVFRYLLLTHREGLGEEPEEVLLTDTPFIVNIFLWIVTSMVLIYIS
ncbi:MAG: decaprenyl-phosphate phosphoribosyltransferase [Bacillota bacterium]